MDKGRTQFLSLIAALLRPGRTTCAYAPNEDYARHLAETAPGEAELERQRATSFERMPLFRIMPVGGEMTAATRASLEAQTYRSFTVGGGEGGYMLRLGRGDILAPDALFRLAEAAAQDEKVQLIYADEDALVSGKRAMPRFKDECSPVTALSYDAIGHMAAVSHDIYSVSLPPPADGDGETYAYNLRCLAHAGRAAHIPRVLLTRRHPPQAVPFDEGIAAIEGYFAITGEKCSVTSGLWRGSFRVSTPSGRRRVAFIVPCRNDADSLRALLESIEENSGQDKYRIVVADCQSTDVRTLAYLDALEKNRAALIVRASGGWAKLMNAGARAAECDELFFLSPNGAVLSPLFVRSMLAVLLRRPVGAVSPKLLSPDGRIMGAGLAVGVGGLYCAPFAGDFDGNETARKDIFINTLRAVSAVSGECMATSSDVFFSSGGFDESLDGGCAHPFSPLGADVEYSLRIARRGYFSAYTPYARFMLRRASEPCSAAPEAVKMRLGDVLRPLLIHGDPYYSPAYDSACAFPVARVRPVKNPAQE